MAFRTQTRDFDQIFCGEKTMNAEFLERLTDYLKTRKMVHPYSDIYERIVKGKHLSAWKCRYDIAADMTELFGEKEIPCIKVVAPNGKIGFITSSDDDADVKDLQEDLKKKLGRFMPVYSGKTLKSMIDGKVHTAVVSISGLSKTECYMMVSQCQKESTIEAVGVDRLNDGTYKFLVYAEDLIKKGNKNLTLAQIYANTKMLLSTPYAKNMIARADRQEVFEGFAAHGFDPQAINNNHSVYIFGEGDLYVKVGNSGLEYGKVERMDGKPKFSPITEISASEKNYKELVTSYASMMVNPIVAKDTHEIANALSAGSIAVSNQELKMAMSQKFVLSHVAKMIDDKQIYNPVMKQSGKFKEKFLDQLVQTKTILLATETKEYPHVYSESETKTFENIVEKNSLNISDYKSVITNIDQCDIAVEYKEIEKLKDLSEFTRSEPAKEKVTSTPTREELGVH